MVGQSCGLANMGPHQQRWMGQQQRTSDPLILVADGLMVDLTTMYQHFKKPDDFSLDFWSSSWQCSGVSFDELTVFLMALYR